MSFKIFSLQLLGKIKPVEFIESKRKTLQDDFIEFRKVEQSEELKHFLELKKFVESENFKTKKKEIESIQFKGSREDNQLKELAKLKKTKQLKNYFKTADSEELKRFKKLKASEKLNNYDQLLEYIKEGQFEKEKKEIRSQVFKGSVEEKHWVEYKRLDKSKAIKAYNELNNSEIIKKHETFANADKLKDFVKLRNAPDNTKEKKKELKALKRDSEIKQYFKFEKSRKLLLYRETVGSHDLKRYIELKEFVEKDEFKKREAFLKDKKKFEKSEAYQKQLKFKELAADSDIKFFLRYKKSSLYKNYLDVTDSFNLKRYYELVEITESEEFLEKKAYLQDPKKWEKTEEYAKQQELLQMKKLPHFVKYFAYVGSNAFDFLKSHEVVFEDDFSKQQLDTEKWATKSFLANKLLGDNYSMAGDLHVVTDGKNIKTAGKLNIQVKKEKAETKVWKMPAGFVPTELEYTSGIISSWNSGWLGDGIFEAKIKFDPKKEIVSSFYLTGEENSPRVNLLEMGTKNRLGISTIDEKGKIKMEGLDISNLKKGQYYIFSLEKNGNSYTWKINENEVLTVSNSVPGDKLHLNAASIVVYDLTGSQLPANFEIDWVKCYRKK